MCSAAEQQLEDLCLQKQSLWQVDILGIYHPPCHKIGLLPCVLLLCIIKWVEGVRDSWVEARSSSTCCGHTLNCRVSSSTSTRPSDKREQPSFVMMVWDPTFLPLSTRCFSLFLLFFKCPSALCTTSTPYSYNFPVWVCWVITQRSLQGQDWNIFHDCS